VLDTCKQLEKKGARVTYLPVNRDGLVDTGELESAIDTHTILIALMFANNELGVIQPVKAIGEIARKHGVLFFTDAAQAVGKIPVSVNEWGIDILSLSAHKMYGPKGVGAIYMRRKNPRVKLQAQIEGGGHERAVRSGTLNVPGIVGLGKACELARKEMEADSARLSQLRDKLERILLEEGDVYINGNQFNRLPHVSNIGFGSASGEALMLACNKDIAVSSGSACSSASMEPSYVLKAIGLSDEEAYGSLRFSLGRFTTEEEIDHVARVLITELRKIRELNRSILSE
jgi:cysteine desulfurase